MKKCLFYLLACICYTVTLSAQNDNGWENAVIIQGSDSLIGKVKYRNEYDIYLDLTFKDSLKATATKQIKAKDITTLILSDYKIQYEPLTFKAKTDTVTILASIITKGAANLYESQIDPEKLGLNEAASPFYLIKSSKGTYPLLHNADPTQTEYDKFKRIVTYVTGDCNNPNEINRLKYTTKDLLQVILDYNKCKDPNSAPSSVNVTSHIPAIVAHQIMIGGVVASQNQLGNERYIDNQYSGGVGINFGYCLQAMYPAISKKVSTEFDFGFTYVKYKSTYFKDKTHNYFGGRLKILGGINLSDKSNIKPMIQIGPSFEVKTGLFAINPLVNLGFGIGFNRYFVGSLIEFPFNSLNYRSFYSLNFKYTFAKSKDEKSK